MPVHSFPTPLARNFSLAAAAAVSLSMGCGVGSAQMEQDNRLVVPGVGMGPVTADVSHDQLVKILGEDQVTDAEIYLAEGFCTSGTVVFPNTPDLVEIIWTDSNRTAVASIVHRGVEAEETAWRTAEGIGIGTTLTELEELNGAPFTFGGLGWDYGGGLSAHNFSPGGLTQALEGLSFLVSETYGTESDWHRDPRSNEIYGDRTVRSDHPIARQAGIRITQMLMTFGPFDPSAEFECE
ncbi:MAG: hypothetical protein OEZ54_07680 [Gemmatimonadota bacterium]|nr:hypothetical protein [Gemmatimonadota bacterium]